MRPRFAIEMEWGGISLIFFCSSAFSAARGEIGSLGLEKLEGYFEFSDTRRDREREKWEEGCMCEENRKRQRLIFFRCSHTERGNSKIKLR